MGQEEVGAAHEKAQDGAHDMKQPQQPQQHYREQLNEEDDDPIRIARYILLQFRDPDDSPTLIYWEGDWWEWVGHTWTAILNERFRALIHNQCAKFFEHLQKAALKTLEDSEKIPRLKKVTLQLVSNVELALKSICISPANIDSPSWLPSASQEQTKVKPNYLVPAKNGLVNIRALAEYLSDSTSSASSSLANMLMLPCSPHFFSTVGVDYAVDLAADRPSQWLQFLHSIWPGDEESVSLLQEWFGYILSGDSSQQKMFYLVGPPRSGKGTISRVLQKLLGLGNCAACSIDELGEQFGLEMMVKKSLAVFEDVFISTRDDAGRICGWLKRLTGQDSIGVRRKFKTTISVTNKARIFMTGNEILRLPDTSGAMASRFSYLVCKVSHLGTEDIYLTDRLLSELPGIFLWAIEGWARLQRNGKFSVPKSTENAHEMTRALGSPLSSFIAEKCTIDPISFVAVDELYDAWKAWCEDEGIKCCPRESFGRLLFSAVPNLTKERRRSPEGRIHVYSGIALRPDMLFDTESDNDTTDRPRRITF
ncbi:MAG: hypothetical protein EBR82_67775 [Caulobacteraceae bacterium]|nr:hypothetical protein [Caulobacteraceae bacterium]